MTGLFLLFVIGVWFIFLLWLIPRLVKKLPSKIGRVFAGIGLFFMLLIAPLTDEVIGGMQFRTLCRESSVIKINENSAKGRTVVLILSDGKNIDGNSVDIREQAWNYLDVETGESLVSYKTLRANGGWLIRALGISENNSPLIFNGVCGPKDSKAIFNRLNMQIIYK